jgi:SAM-dependent methyltransferase
MDEHLHSEQRLGAWRDHLWNIDFLHLMAKRLQLAGVQRALDVGCGRGHWTQALSLVLSAETEFVALDREAEWTRHARAAAGDRSGHIAFCTGEAGQLPFADGAFDLVTCQTLLIHLHDPLQAMREMVRVLGSGGVLLLAEPNNLAQRATYGSSQYDGGLAHLAALWQLQYLCERGKQALGEGFNSIGDRLPGWLADLGLDDIRVHVSDKTLALLPPYQRRGEAELIAMLEQQVQARRWTWPESDARRYFKAGGGDAGEFAALWQAALDEQAAILSAIRRHDYAGSGGFLLYLVSGRKAA